MAALTGSDAAFFALHPALRVVRRRVHQRALTEQLEWALLVAAVGAAGPVVVGRLLALPDWPAAALAWAVLAPLVWSTVSAFRPPDAWRVARAADALGLRERATTALHLLRAGAGTESAAGQLVVADAAAQLARIDPAALPLPSVVHAKRERRRWLTLGIAALTILLAVVPLPPFGPLRAAQQRAADARAAAGARAAVQALEAKVPKTGDDALARATAEELRRLAEELGQTRTADETSRALARSQERLAALPREDDYARQRAIEAAAQQLAQTRQPDLSALSQALRRGDRNADVVLHVRTSFGEDQGTWIGEADQRMEQAIISGVVHDVSEAKITLESVPDRPGIAASVFRAVAEEAINVDTIVQNVSKDGSTDISFTVPKSDLPHASQVMQGVVKEVGAARFTTDEGIAKVSLVGAGMKTHPGVAADMFSALAEADINIEMISTSPIRISCVIRADDVEGAVTALHTRFALSDEAVVREH